MDELTLTMTRTEGIVVKLFLIGVVKEMKDVAKVSEWESEEVQIVLKAIERVIEQLPDEGQVATNKCGHVPNDPNARIAICEKCGKRIKVGSIGLWVEIGG